MGFWSRVKGWFDTGAQKSAAGLLGSVLQSGAPARRGTIELLRAYRTDPWLHAIVFRIAQAVAAESFLLFRAPKKKAPATKVMRNAIAYAPANAQPVEDHPLLTLLDNPSPVFTRATFWALVNAYLDTKGELFLVVERGANGLPVELWIVPPHWCAETPHSAFANYRFSWNLWQRTIAERDVIYLRHPELEQPYQRGAGIGETLADEIDIDEFATKHLKSWFFNRALPDVFLSVEGVADEKEAIRYEEKLRRKHGGQNKAFQVHVVSGKVELKQVGHTFREQQMPELRNQSRDTHLQVYGMPPEIMGIVENSNRATIDAATLIFAKYLVVPRLSFCADAFTKWGRVEYADDTLCLGFISPIPGDATFSLSVMTAQPALFTKNEWRELAGRPPVDGWDEEFAEKAQPALGMGGDPSLGPGKVDDKEDPADEEDDAGDEEEEKHAAGVRGLLRVVNALGQ